MKRTKPDVMRWAFAIQQKIKLALILSGIMLLIVLTNLWERKNNNDLTRTITSIYDDRLVPTADFFYITENLYEKRLLIEDFLAENNRNVEKLNLNLSKHDQEINQLISKYEQTYLVKQEAKSLKEFKIQLEKHNQLEHIILSLALNRSFDVGQSVFRNEGKQSLSNLIKKLEELTVIQTNVGNELIKNSQGTLTSSHMLSTLQISFSIIIGVVIIVLIFSSKITNRSQENFKWN